MQIKPAARGMTLLGFLIVLMLFGFFAFIGMRLFPPYAEHHSVSSAMNSLASEPGVGTKSPMEIKRMLDSKLFINYVTLQPEAVSVDRNAQGYVLHVKYDSRGDMIGNLDYLVSFDQTVVLGPAQQ